MSEFGYRLNILDAIEVLLWCWWRKFQLRSAVKASRSTCRRWTPSRKTKKLATHRKPLAKSDECSKINFQFVTMEHGKTFLRLGGLVNFFTAALCRIASNFLWLTTCANKNWFLCKFLSRPLYRFFSPSPHTAPPSHPRENPSTWESISRIINKSAHNVMKIVEFMLKQCRNFTARCTLKKVSSWGWKRIHWHLRGAYILNWGGVYPFACLNLNGIALERRKPGAKNATLAVRSIMRPLFYSETGLISRLTIIMQMKVLALYWQFLFIF